jgi:hypothetical protein
MQDFSYAGRNYQSPVGNRNEIWINIGWNTKGGQRYAQYNPGIGIGEVQYNALIEKAKELFADGAGITVCQGMMAMMCCSCTCCLSLIYMKLKVDAFNKGAKEGIKLKATELGLNGRLEMIQMASPDSGWFDSTGQQLMIKQGGGEHSRPYLAPGGPPMGYNIIITTPTPMPWPPPAVVLPMGTVLPMVMPMTVVPVAVPVTQRMTRVAAVVPVNGPDHMQQILKLKQLLDDGAITQAEYDQKKQEHLALM